MLEAFGALGLPVTFCSAFGALFRAVQRQPAERVGNAVNYGMAFGSVPGSILAGIVFVREVWL